MHRLFRTVVLALGWAAGTLAAQPLLTPAQVQALTPDAAVRLIDVREASAYALQHVPGALSAPYPRWRATGANLGLPPTLAELTQLVQELGLNPDTRAVLIHTGIDAVTTPAIGPTAW